MPLFRVSQRGSSSCWLESVVLLLSLLSCCSARRGDGVPTLQPQPEPQAARKNYPSLSSFVETGPCAALKSELCDPCYGADDPPADCAGWKQQCEHSFCQPLCLRLTWEVELVPSGSGAFQAQLKEERYKRALEAQMLAFGCERIGCCPKDESTLDWVEHRTYRGYFPEPLLPLPACRGDDDRAGKCRACKVAIKAKARAGACDYFLQPSEPAAAAGPSFAAARVAPASAQTPKHRSFKERCEKLQAKLVSSLSSIPFNQAACACLGCCDDTECPFSVAYPSLKLAKEAV